MFLIMLKLQEIAKKHSKTGGFYAGKTKVTADGIVQNIPIKDNKLQAFVMRFRRKNRVA